MSLGCGNAYQESLLLNKLIENGYDIHYVGVDLSKGMLLDAQDNLQEISCAKTFICADFSQENFKQEIDNVTGKFDTVVRVFLGSSFGNPNQTSIIDLIVKTKLEKSKSEIRRLIKGNAIKLNDKIVNDEKFILSDDLFNNGYVKLSIGKKRHIKIEII